MEKKTNKPVAKVYAGWQLRDGQRVYLVGKYYYFYAETALVSYKIGDMITKDELGHISDWAGHKGYIVPQTAYRLLV